MPWHKDNLFSYFYAKISEQSFHECSSYRPYIMMQILHGFIQKQAVTSSVHILTYLLTYSMEQSPSWEANQ